MIWAARDPLRYAAEVSALAALAGREAHLDVGAMRLGEGGQLVVDIAIDIGGRLFEAVLTYPQSFPAVPPTVRPRDQQLWSFHQYGAGGELCLEHGPDNWMPTLTGADMVASAVRLLETEGGDPLQPTGAVATRHATTLGQDVRQANLRLIATAGLEAALSRLATGALATFSVRYGKPTWRALVSALAADDGSEWADQSIPLALVDAGTTVRGRVLIGLDRLPRVEGTASEVRARLLGVLAAPASEDEILLLVGVDGAMSAAYLYHARDVAFPMTVIRATEPQGRLGPADGAQRERLVAIVGCGSIGSKVAISLARSGVRRFLLVDDDVMLPDNVVRNELDWSDVGLHKIDALAARIRLTVPDADVATRRHRLGGQESSGSLDGAISAIAASDLIVDATADPRAFNYAAAAAGENVAMVWGEVFGGGFGGMVARSRPGLDPRPHLARARIEGWCRDRDRPTPHAAADYGGTLGDRPMVADDTAVATIASTIAAMAIDLLAAREPSRFPHSAYMIGMDAGWIFEGPFDTWPIDLGAPEAPARAEAGQDDAERIAALRDLIDIVGRASG